MRPICSPCRIDGRVPFMPVECNEILNLLPGKERESCANKRDWGSSLLLFVVVVVILSYVCGDCTAAI